METPGRDLAWQVLFETSSFWETLKDIRFIGILSSQCRHWSNLLQSSNLAWEGLVHSGENRLAIRFLRNVFCLNRYEMATLKPFQTTVNSMRLSFCKFGGPNGLYGARRRLMRRKLASTWHPRPHAQYCYFLLSSCNVYIKLGFSSHNRKCAKALTLSIFGVEIEFIQVHQMRIWWNPQKNKRKNRKKGRTQPTENKKKRFHQRTKNINDQNFCRVSTLPCSSVASHFCSTMLWRMLRTGMS